VGSLSRWRLKSYKPPIDEHSRHTGDVTKKNARASHKMLGHPAPQLSAFQGARIPKRSPQRVRVLKQRSPVRLTRARFYSRLREEL
jgi:hypothetical protein